MLSVDEILKYVTKYDISEGFVKDENGNRVTDQKVINEYNNAQKIYNGIMSYKNVSKTDLSNEELLGLAVTEMNDLNISEKEYSESEINEKVKEAVIHALNKKKEVSLQAKAVLDYVNNYYVLVNSEKAKGSTDPEAIKHYQDYCDSVKIYSEALKIKNINGSDKELEEIIEEVKNKINLTSDRKISLSVEEIKDYTYNYHYDLHHKEDDTIEQNADIINNYLKATDIYNKALELQKQTGSDVSIEELIDEVLAKEVPKKDESQEPSRESETPSQAEEDSEPTLSPTQKPNQEEQSHASKEKILQPGPKRIVVERRLKHWQSKAKASIITFILRGANEHTKDYVKIYENIAILQAHFSVWTIEKMQEALNIIISDINSSTELEDEEKETLNRECKKITKKIKKENISRLKNDEVVENSESLPDDKAKQLDNVENLSDDKDKQQENEEFLLDDKELINRKDLPRMNVKNVISQPVFEAKDKEKVPAKNIILTSGDMKKKIEKRYSKWSNELNKFDNIKNKISEKYKFLSFILRKANHHTIWYQKILENIIVLRAHYPYWTMEKVKKSVDIINSDIKEASKLLRDDEKKRLEKICKWLYSKLKFNEIDRIKNDNYVLTNQIVADLPFKRVFPNPLDNSMDEEMDDELQNDNNQDEKDKEKSKETEQENNQSLEKDQEDDKELHKNPKDSDQSDDLKEDENKPNSEENNKDEKQHKEPNKPDEPDDLKKEENKPGFGENNKDEKQHKEPNKPDEPRDLKKEENKPDSGGNNKDEEQHKEPNKPDDLKREENKPDSEENNKVEKESKEPITFDEPGSENNPKGSSEEESEKNDKMHEKIKNYYQSLLNDLKSRQVPKITKEEYDSLSPDLQRQYQQLQLGEKVIVGGVESALIMYFQYFTTFGLENLENDFSPFAR